MNAIRDIFNDERDMFEIEQNTFLLDDESEIVKIRHLFGDLTPEVLADIIEECEELYEKFSLPVQVYAVLSPKFNVTVAEHSIQSDAEFSIKVAVLEKDPIAIVLEEIERKIKHERFTEMDMNMLHILPMMVNKEDRKKVRAKASELITLALEN